MTVYKTLALILTLAAAVPACEGASDSIQPKNYEPGRIVKYVERENPMVGYRIGELSNELARECGEKRNKLFPGDIRAYMEFPGELTDPDYFSDRTFEINPGLRTGGDRIPTGTEIILEDPCGCYESE